MSPKLKEKLLVLMTLFSLCLRARSLLDHHFVNLQTSEVEGNFSNSGAKFSGSYAVNQVSEDYPQLRIDLETFNVGTIDYEGGCSGGRLTISDQEEYNIPTLCGENSGQHLYVSFDDAGTPITLTINGDENDYWNIKTTQILYSDLHNLAPSGCLQFFNTAAGSVKSFGYQNVIPEDQETFQLSNLNYMVCIGAPSQFSEVRWSRGPGAVDSFFSLTSNIYLYGSLLGSVDVADFDADCTTDFVGISGGSFTNFYGNQQTASWFCGVGFPSQVISSSTQLYVVTNSVELQDGDTGNAGFFLSFLAV